MTVNEPPNDSPAIGSTRERPTFSRVLLVLAATVVLLVGMRLAAPVLNPIIFAVVLSLLFGPIYAWLGRRGVPRPLGLVIMLVGLTLLFLVIF
jgi:AI-2 transport protein TqsA